VTRSAIGWILFCFLFAAGADWMATWDRTTFRGTGSATEGVRENIFSTDHRNRFSVGEVKRDWHLRGDTHTHYGGGVRCGLKPLKPIPPAGCRDLIALCVCDRDGRNCRWEWVCVR